MFRYVVWRDLVLALRRRADVLATLFFFVIVVSLFPLSTAWIHDGRLVAPLDVRIGGGTYAFACRPRERHSAELEAVRAFVRARFDALAPLDAAPRAKRPRRR